MLLADGETPIAIAEMVGGGSRNTLKSQLASIYRKTGTSPGTGSAAFVATAAVAPMSVMS